MRMIFLAGSLAFSMSATAAQPTVFQHGDWSIGCNNIGHCEAVGHQQDGDGEAIAMSIARAAGPGAPLRVQLIIPESEGAVDLRIGRQRMADVAVEQDLPAAQVRTLLPWLLKEQAVVATIGKQEWRLSLAGLNAVLLKMDEVQGRLDTPGALIRKGTKPEAGVPKPGAVPRVVTAPLPTTTSRDEGTAARLAKTLPQGDCQDDLEASVTRLSGTKLLLMRQCIQGAYQSGWDLWIVNDKPPHAPIPAALPWPGEKPGNELTEPSFVDGVLSSYGKGRGINDCGVSAEWVWTGQGFAMLSWQRAIMCRELPGGWPVSLWEAAVTPAKPARK